MTSNVLEALEFPENSRIQVIKAAKNRLMKLPSNISKLQLLQIADFETNEFKELDLTQF